MILEQLSKSTFRNQFKLTEKEKQYIEDKGIDTIRQHSYQFVQTRLAPKEIKNDGKQTPMKGHPVFIAQHATATCCRNCLYKWHRIPKNIELKKEQDDIVNIIMEWIQKQI